MHWTNPASSSIGVNQASTGGGKGVRLKAPPARAGPAEAANRERRVLTAPRLPIRSQS